MCVKVIARQNSDIFLRHSVVLKIWGGERTPEFTL